MLRSVEVTAVLILGDVPAHNLHWTGEVELSLDCFICRRTGRTTDLRLGAEHGSCSGDGRTARHPTAVRIAAFDHTAEQDRITLRAVVDHWWAPFLDTKQNQPGLDLTQIPWVRLHLGYLCPEPVRPGSLSTQTNLGRPQTLTCEHCAAPVARSHVAPRIRLLT